MKILVTGGTGFVGKNLIERLLDLDHEVTAICTSTENDLPDSVQKLYLSLEGLDWTKVCGQEVLFHQAANNDTQCQNEKEMLRANLYGPISLFHRVKDGGCKHFIYASSTAVYGNAEAPYVEGETPEEPLTFYGDSKKRFDEFAMKFAEENKVSVTGLRYCNIYGPGEGHKGKRMSMVGQMLRTMKKGLKSKLFNSGEQQRDWLYVKDAVDANWLALDEQIMNMPLMNGIGKIFNLGTGEAVSFNEVAYEIMELIHNIDHSLSPKYVECPFPETYQNYTCCDIKKAQQELGFLPKFNLSDGLRDYLLTESW